MGGPGDAGRGPTGDAERRPAADASVAPDRLLRWGLPRDPKAVDHVLGFVVTTVLTIVVTRGYLQLTGFPQIGGETLHVAHVLWGGLAMAIAMVLALSFAGPVVRPLVAFVGGVGFGLFIDEVGKFLTQDNDYFFSPAPMIMYLTLVGVVLLADVLHGRRPPHPIEHVAAAADHAVAGIAGGLSERRRAVAEDLLAKGDGARGSAETAALLAVVPDDDAEVPDPLDAAGRRLQRVMRAVAGREWALRSVGVALGALVAVSLGAVVLSLDEAADPTWARVTTVVTVGLSLAAVGRALTWLRRDRYRAFQWLRRAVLVNVLLTQVAVFRIEPWLATLGLFVALVALGIIAAERHRLERLHRGEG
ncbi:hypothetical protein [Georgenia muralis]|uniref:Uncharacterized protein n=1 Tax=Georgenia muralis TaxID=154117 RepID=A0A3N4ZRR2_9MICO|nr:hypothetical protein [Georgenia muralis]RPF28208.1 hypothetical protein EDD32_2722 [Georgenia muralis]